MILISTKVKEMHENLLGEYTSEVVCLGSEYMPSRMKVYMIPVGGLL